VARTPSKKGKDEARMFGSPGIGEAPSPNVQDCVVKILIDIPCIMKIRTLHEFYARIVGFGAIDVYA